MGSSGHAQHGDHRGPPVAHELERWSSCKKRPGSWKIWKGLSWGLPPRAPATTLDLQTSPNNQQPWTRVVPTPSLGVADLPALSMVLKKDNSILWKKLDTLDTLQHLSAYDQWRIPLYLELGDLKWDPFIAKGLKSNWQCLSWKHSRAIRELLVIQTLHESTAQGPCTVAEVVLTIACTSKKSAQTCQGLKDQQDVSKTFHYLHNRSY